MNRVVTIEEFYKEVASFTGQDVTSLLPQDMQMDIGHFNVFDISETLKEIKRTKVMPYNRRAYYKISLICGKNRAEYADKVINIEKNALLFATPKVPYHWIPLDDHQFGSFCVFTGDFMLKNKSGVVLDKLPIFKSGSYPIFEVSDRDAEDIALIFNKMKSEIASEYEYKYDLLRNYVLELIHYGQKLQPASSYSSDTNAATRIISLFIELLERQFPIESTHQKLQMRSAKAYAERLSIHTNHLNKVLKENTGKTTTEIIAGRMIQEAKILLKETNWNISEIGYTLGFEEVAHFSNFFKKQTSQTPLDFRSAIII